MTDKSDKSDSFEPAPARDFESEAEQAQPGILREFWDFLRYSKKWWLTPIIVVLLLVGVLIVVGEFAPLIYAIF